jgi:hypothetical protein
LFQQLPNKLLKKNSRLPFFRLLLMLLLKLSIQAAKKLRRVEDTTTLDDRRSRIFQFLPPQMSLPFLTSEYG